MWIVISFLGGFVVGGVVVWLSMRTEMDELEDRYQF